MTRKTDYDALAPGYDRRYRENDYGGVERTLVEFVGTPPVRVLEVGCGTGHWLGVLAERGVEIAGVDTSVEMLARARARSPGIELVQASAERLPFATGSFDRVCCVNALHHFPKKNEFFCEARRVLRNSGAVLTIGLDPQAGTDRWWIYDWFDGSRERDLERYPSAAQIREWMSEAGFASALTVVAQHLQLCVPARHAIDSGLVHKGMTSQLAILSDEEYAAGIAAIHAADPIELVSDLRLYATTGRLQPVVELSCR